MVMHAYELNVPGPTNHCYFFSFYVDIAIPLGGRTINKTNPKILDRWAYTHPKASQENKNPPALVLLGYKLV